MWTFLIHHVLPKRLGLSIIDIQAIARTFHIAITTVIEHHTIKRLSFTRYHQVPTLIREIIGIDAPLSIDVNILVAVQ